MVQFNLPNNSKLTKGKTFKVSDNIKNIKNFLFIDGLQRMLTIQEWTIMK